MSMSAKMVLIMILFASIIVPARAAAAPNPRKALKKALVQMTVFNLIYVLSVTYLYPRLL
jgi:hypothetical protein